MPRGAMASTVIIWWTDGDGAFTIWYERDGVAVGVLTHEADDDYDLGKDLIGRHRPAPIKG